MTKTSKYKNLIFHNGSYKIVALFVSLALWITILGREDATMNHEMELQFLTHPAHQIVNNVRSTVKVSLSGPRSGLNKFRQSDEVISLNLEKLEPGRRVIKIPKDGISVPLGVKVLNIEPERIKITLRKLPTVEEAGE